MTGAAKALVIVVVAVAFAIAALWTVSAVGLVTPGNVRAQWQFAYDYDESLRAIARQVCTAEKAVATATSDAERTQRRTQQIAIENNYARVAAEYDAHLRDAFRAGLVRPPDVPDRAPSLPDAKRQACTS